MSKLVEQLREPWFTHSTASLQTRAAERIEKLEAALSWYADQTCEGLCEGRDARLCATIGADRCAGCPAVIALNE